MIPAVVTRVLPVSILGKVITNGRFFLDAVEIVCSLPAKMRRCT
jgi:hypothetical protein